jgi:hypothetical protein
MFADQYPFAGGTGHYAAYLENITASRPSSSRPASRPDRRVGRDTTKHAGNKRLRSPVTFAVGVTAMKHA